MTDQDRMGWRYWSCSNCGEWFVMNDSMKAVHDGAFPDHKPVHHSYSPPTAEQIDALNEAFGQPIGTSSVPWSVDLLRNLP